MTLRQKYQMLRHTLQFYASESHYDLGNSRMIATDRGQRAREILTITEGADTPEDPCAL